MVCAFALPAAAKLSVARKKQIAGVAYAGAERMREALNGRPPAGRGRADFQRVIDAYRKVYYTAPNSIRADASVLAVAELLAGEGRAFHDEKLLRAAIGQYEFLRKEYPGSSRRVGALFAIAQIYADDLGDDARAKQTFQEFLKHYPRSELADDARKSLAGLNAGVAKKSRLAKDAKPDVAARHAAPRKILADAGTAANSNDAAAKADAVPDRGATSRGDLPPAVRAAAEKADAVVDKLDGKAPKPDTKKSVETPAATSREKSAETLPATSPAREKSDTAKPDPAKPEQAAPAESARKGKLPLVTGIRHWSTPDYTRIAVDLEQEVAYEVGRVSGPDRLFFDLHGTKLAPGLMGKEYEVEDGLLKKVRVAQFLPGETRIVLDLGEVADYQAFLLPNPYRLIVDVHGKKKTPVAKASSDKTSAPTPVTVADKKHPDDAAKALPETKPAAATALRTDSPSRTNDVPPDSVPHPEGRLRGPKGGVPATNVARAAKAEVKANDSDDDVPSDSVLHPESKPKGGAPASRSVVAREARPTASGDRSLIRALGLKIGRIVVDAGHGGHDTGTIGPSGLLEKDLVLDVALRLGKLLESRMGADVVYTRDDDTFVPLETRTAIANREQADLFISVHANSSRNPKARGVETYYLNFTTSADALEVAARENAVSDTSIHELQDLVKKIALKEKVEESREFASDVQQSLKAGLSGRGGGMRDRGVRKAPFIVLIGANMPSILAEISFLSNPADERRLKTLAYRQKIAESLYRGIASYVSGLSGVKVAANASNSKGGQ